MKPIFKYILFASALPLLASCSSEEPGVETLPEGKYPMEFSLSFAPQSRVSTTDDGMGCKWEEGDKVTIKVTQNGEQQTATATLDADGNIVSCEPQLYWTSTQPATVTACYTNIDSTSTDNYTDQSQGLAYVMSSLTTAPFGQPAQLVMEHKLAQVRLTISGFRADEYGDALFYGYHDYTITEDGELTTTAGTGRGYIKMQKDEALGCYIANVAPGDLTINDDFKLFTFSNGVQAEIAFNNTIKAGQVYTFRLESNPAPFTINGYEAVLMRRASGTPGTADYVPALYFAACDLGATTPYEAGKYFWWGDVVGHTPEDGFNFSTSTNQNTTIEEYFQNGFLTSPNIIDSFSEGVLTPEHDAATQQWGGPWRIMTYAESRWLCDNTTNEFHPADEESGSIAYHIITSKDTGNSIIIPLVGYCYNVYYAGKNVRSLYWTSQIYEEHQGSDYISYIGSILYLSKTSYMPFISSVTQGNPIRPVASF